jgi:hypothetical protein
MNRYGHMPYATSVESDGVVVDRANRDHENWSEIGLTEAELDAARLASESVVDDE